MRPTQNSTRLSYGIVVQESHNGILGELELLVFSMACESGIFLAGTPTFQPCLQAYLMSSGTATYPFYIFFIVVYVNDFTETRFVKLTETNPCWPAHIDVSS